MTKSKPGSCTPFLKALADKTRWNIVQELLTEPRTVSELTKRLKATQYNVSKHLRILREAGIVTTTKDGKLVLCAIAPDFRKWVARDKNKLDLGCCVFHFDKKPC